MKLELPRTEFLLRRVKLLEDAIVEWYKNNHYSQGDDYWVAVTKNGKWMVGYSNDYPMQHGEGEKRTLSEKEFFEATKNCWQALY